MTGANFSILWLSPDDFTRQKEKPSISKELKELSLKVPPYCFLKSLEKANFILKKYHEYFGKEWN